MPGGKWHTLTRKPVSSATRWSSDFHRRVWLLLLHHRLAALLEDTRLVVDGGELGVTVGMLGAFPCLAGALQAVVQRGQQVRHGRVADPPAPLDPLPGVPAFGVEPLRRQVLRGLQAGGGGLHERAGRAALPGRETLPKTDEDLAQVRRAPPPQRSPSGWLPASACQEAVSFG